MAATPETKAKQAVKKVLDEFKGTLKMKLTWNAGAAFGPATLDCTGVIAGVAFAIEVKRLDGQGKLTARQFADLCEYRDAGAVAMVIEDAEGLEHLRACLRALAVLNSCVVSPDWCRIPTPAIGAPRRAPRRAPGWTP